MLVHMLEKTSIHIPDDTLLQIQAVLEPGLETPFFAQRQEDAIITMCRYVMDAMGIRLHKPPQLGGKESDYQTLLAIARASHCRLRRVTLAGKWWCNDNGPLLVFQKETHLPGALIYKSGRYQLLFPSSSQMQVVDAQVASTLELSAFYFYRPFPESSMTWRKLLRFAFSNLRKEVRQIISLQILIAILGLFVPIATGVIFDQVIPNADPNLLLQFVVALVVNAVAITFFNLAQVIALMRVELKMNVSVQAAVWDRLLRLSSYFFRKYAAGDLAFRASGIDRIQQALTGAILLSVVSGAFSLITFILMFYYDAFLALGTLLLVLFVVIVNIIATLVQLKYQRTIFHLQGKLSALLLQLFNNIAKLRIANRERQAFRLWSNLFTRRTRWSIKARLVVIRLRVFQTTFIVLATAILFIMVILRGEALSFGSFITFNAAFGQFFAAFLSMTGAFAGVLQIIPLYERARPILHTVPEAEQQKMDPGELTGQIECNHVVFRYSSSSFQLFKDISLKIAPGEFIAIVGPSGAGKSTFIRLLLGFEIPDAGHILYDGRDLTTLNVQLVRRQLGVVLQNNLVMPGTIFENIAGATPLTREQAWESVHLVGLDKDIKGMPMGIDTIVSEAGKTLSVGQRQRLLLARALAHKPRFLLLDEATTALDNVTQASVFDNLAKLPMTKIVIAHRLSTIAHSDHIYVLDKGEIVQSGIYQELIQAEGLFAQLANRQQM